MISLSVTISAKSEDDIVSFIKEGDCLEDCVQIAIKRHKQNKNSHHLYDELSNDGTVSISIDIEEEK